MKLKKVFIATLAATSAMSLAACGEVESASALSFNLAYGNSDRTMTYNQGDALTIDGKTYNQGALKPVWQQLESKFDMKFTNNTGTASTSSISMMSTAATGQFKDSNIYGGTGIAEDFMYYGSEGYFVDLTDYEEYLPNFTKYIDANKDIKASITAYDGGIYHIPYVSEIGETARTYNMRAEWVEALLDDFAGTTYDTTSTNTDTNNALNAIKAGTYTSFYGEYNRPAVSPKTGVTINKKNTTNIIDIQNELGSNATPSNLTEALINYIDAAYGVGNESSDQYSTYSELFIGDKAAYDMDELVALLRCIKVNPRLVSGTNDDKSAASVVPFFVRQTDYKEDVLRFASYFDGVKVYGSDSYTSPWYIDAKGDIQYTYIQEEFYGALTKMNQMFSEGLIHNDPFTTTSSTNYRAQLYGGDAGSNPAYGFMSYDWIASSTSDDLNSQVEVVLPPVANINGSWQYYIDNSRTVKPDGWAISSSSSASEIKAACELFDYFFTEEGSQLQNYGVDGLLVEGGTFTGPDNIEYPEFQSWVLEAALTDAEGDLSAYLRDWIGALMPIGFQKEIGFEYQYTDSRGIAGIDLIANSNVVIPSYKGGNLIANSSANYNPNYDKLVPASFSLSKIDSNLITTYAPTDSALSAPFNVIRGGGSYTTYAAYYAVFASTTGTDYIEKYVNVYQDAYKFTLSALS